MEGSDDFYFDDLTEADLAVADEVESKYIESQRTQTLQRKASQSQLPPAKRQKTEHTYHPPETTVICDTTLNATPQSTGRLIRSSSLHAAAAVAPDVPLAGGYFTPIPQVNRNGRASPAPSNYHAPQRYPPNRPDAYVIVHSTFASPLEHPLIVVRNIV